MSPRLQCIPLTAALLVLAAISARADAPMEAPERHTVPTASKSLYGVVDPDSHSFVVYRRNAGKTVQKLWEMAVPVYADTSLSDDGDFVAFGYWGGELLSLKHRPDETMISFYRRGQLIRDVPLTELIVDPGKLRRTMSHKYWGEYVGFLSGTRFAVQTVEERYVILDATTGKVIEARPTSDPPPELRKQRAARKSKKP